jgi:hypothetical protein
MYLSRHSRHVCISKHLVLTEVISLDILASLFQNYLLNLINLIACCSIVFGSSLIQVVAFESSIGFRSPLIQQHAQAGDCVYLAQLCSLSTKDQCISFGCSLLHCCDQVSLEMRRW